MYRGLLALHINPHTWGFTSTFTIPHRFSGGSKSDSVPSLSIFCIYKVILALSNERVTFQNMTLDVAGGRVLLWWCCTRCTALIIVFKSKVEKSNNRILISPRAVFFLTFDIRLKIWRPWGLYSIAVSVFDISDEFNKYIIRSKSKQQSDDADAGILKSSYWIQYQLPICFDIFSIWPGINYIHHSILEITRLILR